MALPDRMSEAAAALTQEMVPGAVLGAHEAAPSVLEAVVPPLLGPSDSGRVGRFETVKPLGAGAMGYVVLARDTVLDRLVALKLINEQVATAEMRERFVREAQALALVNHRNVVKVYEAGQSDGQAFIAMEYVPGRTIRGWSLQAPRTWQEVVDVYVQAGRGLAAAHDAGLVHRDFKPGNVIVSEDGRSVVLDFGLVRRAHDERANDPFGRLTASGERLGTPGYMAPERVGGGRGDARSDQFNFCASLFDTMFGKRPYGAGPVHEAVKRATGDTDAEPDPLWEVPDAVHDVILRGLEKDPNDRFASMHELLVALEQARSEPPARRWWMSA